MQYLASPSLNLASLLKSDTGRIVPHFEHFFVSIVYLDFKLYRKMKLLPQSPDLRYLVRVLPVRVKYDPLPGEATYAFLPEPVQDICHSFFEGGGISVCSWSFVFIVFVIKNATLFPRPVVLITPSPVFSWPPRSGWRYAGVRGSPPPVPGYARPAAW